MRIAFLLPVLGHPRIHKRIQAVADAGADTRLLAFERDVPFKRGELPPYESLGRLKDGRYLARALPYGAALSRVRRVAKSVDALYCFSADLLALAVAATLGMQCRPKLVCEVADIRGVLLGDHPAARSARKAEAQVIQRADLVVVTSQAYIDGFYGEVQGLRGLPSLLIENKVESDALPPPEASAERNDGILRIVYSGLMCCGRSWRLISRLAKQENERVQVRLHGIFQGELAGLESEVAGRRNIEYFGPFEAPRELPAIFGWPDLVWIAHAYGEANQAWARANRFYQAGYFGKPMVAQRGTEDGRVVESENFGPVIDLHDPDSSLECLAKIGPDDLRGWRQAIEGAPRDLFVLGDEHDQLLARLAR